jgi:hypothetical protein
MGKVNKDLVNPHFKNKYASLSNIIEAVTPHLTANGLTIVQMPTQEGLETLLLHGSGEYIGSTSTIVAKDASNPQSVGSAITYARRYAIGAVLSLNIDEDDDANAATTPPKAVSTAPGPPPKAVSDVNALALINSAATIAGLQAVWMGLSKAEQLFHTVVDAKDERKSELTK